MAEPEKGEQAPAKTSGPLPVIAAVAVLTLLGAGGGWAIGTMIAAKAQPVSAAGKTQVAAAEKKSGDKKAGEGLPRISNEANGIVQLEPITTNLAYPSENWVRVEVALLFNGAPDVKLSEAIHQDILAYLRTVSLQQIEGPRGFQYLKDDIQERVDLRSEGRVSKIMFRTFVVE